ncbi:hypothetical protein SAMN04489835_3333 [Mycolicibacterium rutilum]|uniref:Uncharacterized protein n=1 Tax=Mycolicibacterium rutilum TaxID=370526 RepID=A0A1H6KH34_MYCRU|nr:hypothetical protein SAMN04489835_3333 [Mycolicibacterium rutilum]
MNMLMICLLIAVPLLGLCLYDTQRRLERWDHDRHAED